MSADPEYIDARRIALNLLAQREQSKQELRRKLLSRGCAAAKLEQLIAELQQQNLQSDTRFAENYIRWRQGKGFGPVRIANELRERGVADELIAEFLDEQSSHWHDIAMKVWQKRFGQAPQDSKERAKQARFLVYRGFSFDVVKRIVNEKIHE